MIDDIRPARRPGRSLRAALEKLPATKTHEPEEETAETFRTPEEVAAAQTLEADIVPDKPTPAADQVEATEPAAEPPKSGVGWRQKLSLSWPPGKKEYWLLGLMLILIGGGLTAWHLKHHTKTPAAVIKHTIVKKVLAPPAPTTVPSTLTGLPVNPSVNKLPVTGVMIENSDFARPQSGLGEAGVVFEAIAEGGITRFLALFQDTAPDNVGPIRSARPYYEQWALGFDAAFAHVGGSPEALTDIKTWGVRDLNEFYNGSYYHRISSREAPHNVYTGIPTLNQLETKLGYTGSNFTGFPRKAEAPAKQPTARTINFTLSGPDFNVAYNYDPASNSYKRSEAGAPHIDANSSGQITAKVVVAMVIAYSLESDGYHSDYAVIGSGPAYVFQDGAVTIGQWTKSGNANQIVFTDANNVPIKLDAGRTWITAVAGKNDVSYSP